MDSHRLSGTRQHGVRQPQKIIPARGSPKRLRRRVLDYDTAAVGAGQSYVHYQIN